MNEYKFSHTFRDHNGKEMSTIDVTTHADSLDDLLEDFKSFLLGCTFSPELVDSIQRVDED